jgi:hypothetical protein
VAIDFALTPLIASIGSVIPLSQRAGTQSGRATRLNAAHHGSCQARRPRRAAELWWESPLLAGVRQSASAVRYRPVVLDNARVWTLPNRPPPLQPPAGTRLSELEVPMLVVAGEPIVREVSTWRGSSKGK